MCGSATLAIVLSRDCMNEDSMIEAVIRVRRGPSITDDGATCSLNGRSALRRRRLRRLRPQVVRLPCSFESPVIGDALSMRACRIIAIRVRGGGSSGMTGSD